LKFFEIIGIKICSYNNRKTEGFWGTFTFFKYIFFVFNNSLGIVFPEGHRTMKREFLSNRESLGRTFCK